MEAVRRTGPRPGLVVRLAAHHASTRWRQLRLRRSYPSLVTVEKQSRLRLPPVGLEPVDRWPPALADAIEDLRSECAAAVRHRFDLLGSGPIELGAEIDWHRDFKSGFRWPEVFYQDVEQTRLDDDSDAKVPWELSRGHQLLALGRGTAIFGDHELPVELERQLRSWIETNPPGFGINWTNAMEVSIRAINWIWALACAEAQWPIPEPLRALLARSLAAHGRHIWHNLEGTPQLRSNHYLSDVVGLLAIGWALEDDPLASRWLAYARRSLEREVRAQVLPDGVDFEASLSYHGLVLELFLIARWILELADMRPSQHFDERVREMLVASLTLRHADGRIPQFGDCDSGRVLPASSHRPPTHDHLLWLGSALLGTPVPANTAAHEEVAFTLGLDAWRKGNARAPRMSACDLPRAASFPVAGLHVLRRRGSHLVVRCGGVGQNGNGGHAHNDLLSFELSCGRRLVTADPGTYAYTSDPPARNSFRATRAHSTVIIDGEEINPIDQHDLFRLRQIAAPLAYRLDASADPLELTCAHDGYRRLVPPVIVHRTFRLARDGDELLVIDEVENGGDHSVRSHLQLATGWTVQPTSAASFALLGHGVRLRLDLFGHVRAAVREGWVSSRFGVRQGAPVIALDAAHSEPAFGYRIVGLSGAADAIEDRHESSTRQPTGERSPADTSGAPAAKSASEEGVEWSDAPG